MLSPKVLRKMQYVFVIITLISFIVLENDCRERWKNIRGRYGKYKKAKAKPTDKLAKRVKEYYLAPYLSYLDNFLKARPYKRLFRKSLKTETHEGETHDDNEDMHADESLQWPWPHQSTQPHQQADSCFVVPVDPALSSEYMGSELAAALQDATEAEKAPIIKKKTVKLDTDLSFLKSVLPDMKAMTPDQKRRFKIGILNMAGEILKENSRCTMSSQCRGGPLKAPTPPSQ